MRISAHFIAFLMLVMTMMLTACQQTMGVEAEMNGLPYRVVTVDELQTMLEKKDFLLVNVHTPFEGNIPQTDLHFPYDEISQKLDQLPAEKDAKLLVYCLTSGMAKEAIATLLEAGYTNLWMLEGGTTAWLEAGQILETE